MQRTPFYQFHKDHGGRFVNFAGWEMPITYGSIHEEHRQVRTSGGLFDVSHMGRIKIVGRQPNGERPSQTPRRWRWPTSSNRVERDHVFLFMPAQDNVCIGRSRL